ncbi:rifin [Plasmodium falciparum NF54]|uniref:Rifin n=2 Tax=Plasmodium falciparum TaxID=5833 RepID=Q8IM80_PLAF7|nr:rifin [Plasmodium falciparum 3D7]EWC86103.1 hypothetical protein PFNF54_04834 [Plasmodium falciparum NF54]KAF4329628.1 rifin [Plasmodium falciparum NF54]PKC49343.1 rifin [Plasmodium falciparum NF54]CZT99713.1 rifin [Plasmodium falciparum 3D7]|eukprot:XP_001348183.1 rifin [Plasmodium falciparum 3D7]
MKLLYSKILLFALALNILLTSYYAHNKNKPYIIPRYTPTATSRVLSECDIHAPIYYNDEDMKSVKENFERQTSRRFEEYNERMNKNRQKCKEQRDKDIQKIILKDKIEKSLEEKVEKGCLRCACGLGGVAAGVGIIGAIAVNEWTKVATAAAVQKGIKAGIAKAIDDLGNIVGLIQFDLIDWAAKIDGINFLKQNSLVSIVNEVYYKCIDIENSSDFLFCSATKAWDQQKSTLGLQIISNQAAEAAVAAGKAAETAEKAEIVLVNAKSSLLYSAIGYSVIAILIIVLVMIIIYLILRYRRTKKMNKKAEYTKLLNK